MPDLDNDDDEDDGDRANGKAQVIASDTTQPEPTPAIRVSKLIDWGVAPDGTDTVLVVETHAGQPLKLYFDRPILADLVANVRAALGVSQRNQASNSGGDSKKVVLAAERADTFQVGYTVDTDGVMLIFNPDTPFQAAYNIASETALRMATMVHAEATSRAKQEKRIHDIGNPAIALPGAPKLILPEGVLANRRK